MSGWGVLPLLPLRCILEHLRPEDAMQAMSVCRHWRNAVLLYEGHKDLLKLEAKQMEKNMFLLRLFRKYVKKIHVYLDCNEAELDKFMTYIVPQFFDAVKLEELLFIGPNYLNQDYHKKLKLKRIITESLVYKQLRSLHTLALLGCEIDTAKNDYDVYTSNQIEYYSRSLSFNSEKLPGDAILSRSNANMMVYSAIQHIIVDYKHISMEVLRTLSHLGGLRQLTAVIKDDAPARERIDWRTVQTGYTRTLDVAIVVVGLSPKKIQDVIDYVLVDGMNLTSLKMLFCQTIYVRMLTHVVNMYKSSLRELVWADAPDCSQRIIRRKMTLQYPIRDIHPFILLCWQCTQLQRLVIHGYWIWQYDVVGFARLRKSLHALDVSRVRRASPAVTRAHRTDLPQGVATELIEQVNEFTDFEWAPTEWESLHPALRPRATNEQRADYIVKETMNIHVVT